MDFLADGYNYLDGLVQMHQIQRKKTKCNWCILVSKLDAYLKSLEYIQKCCLAFNVDTLIPMQNRICTQMMFSILTRIVKHISEDTEQSTPTENQDLAERELQVLR